MLTRKKAKVPRAARAKPAVVATIDDTAKSEEVAAEVVDVETETEEKVQEKTGKKGKKGKSCEGVWNVEMKGPYGWEHIAMSFMRNGEYLGAGPNHYSVGSYKQDGNNLEMSITVTQYGELRTIFGRKSTKDLKITSKCKINKDKIIGISKAKSINKFDVMIRLSRIGSLD